MNLSGEKKLHLESTKVSPDLRMNVGMAHARASAPAGPGAPAVFLSHGGRERGLHRVQPDDGPVTFQNAVSAITISNSWLKGEAHVVEIVCSVSATVFEYNGFPL